MGGAATGVPRAVTPTPLPAHLKSSYATRIRLGDDLRRPDKTYPWHWDSGWLVLDGYVIGKSVYLREFPHYFVRFENGVTGPAIRKWTAMEAPHLLPYLESE